MKCFSTKISAFVWKGGQISITKWVCLTLQWIIYDNVACTSNHHSLKWIIHVPLFSFSLSDHAGVRRHPAGEADLKIYVIFWPWSSKKFSEQKRSRKTGRQAKKPNKEGEVCWIGWGGTQRGWMLTSILSRSSQVPQRWLPTLMTLSSRAMSACGAENWGWVEKSGMDTCVSKFACGSYTVY